MRAGVELWSYAASILCNNPGCGLHIGATELELMLGRECMCVQGESWIFTAAGDVRWSTGGCKGLQQGPINMCHP
jgi:hypothetical protein